MDVACEKENFGVGVLKHSSYFYTYCRAFIKKKFFGGGGG